MKNLLIGLIALGSISAFAASFEGRFSLQTGEFSEFCPIEVEIKKDLFDADKYWYDTVYLTSSGKEVKNSSLVYTMKEEVRGIVLETKITEDSIVGTQTARKFLGIKDEMKTITSTKLSNDAALVIQETSPRVNPRHNGRNKTIQCKYDRMY